MRSMLGRRALAEGCARARGARAAVRREMRAVAAKRLLPRGRAPGVMCMGLRNFLSFSSMDVADDVPMALPLLPNDAAGSKPAHHSLPS